MGVVGVQDAECHGGEDDGEVEEEGGGDGLLNGVLADDAILEVVQVEREPPEEVLADAFADVIPLKGETQFLKSSRNSLAVLFIP